MRTLLSHVALGLAAAFVLGCASTSSGSSSKKDPPARYDGMLLRRDLLQPHWEVPEAVCAPGWKRDPDRDGFFLNDWAEDEYAELGWRHARVHYAWYAPPSEGDAAQPDTSTTPLVGAWRHRGWWVEPEWEELQVLRTDVALGRAPGASTWTRLALTPGGVTAREETDIRRLATARYGDKPNEHRDRVYAVLGAGVPAPVGLLSDDCRVVARVAAADPDYVVRLGFGGYLVRTAKDGAWWYHVLDDAGAPLVEPFDTLTYYEPPALEDQADRSVAYPRKHLLPVEVPADVARLVRERHDGVLAWPIALADEFVPLPELCLGAVLLGAKTWAVYWESPDGPRVAFSDAGVMDVADMAASSGRARWVDYGVEWVQFLPFDRKRRVLKVAEKQEDGSLQWHAFLNGDCEDVTLLGPDPHASKESLELALVDLEERALEDQRRIEADRAAEEARIAEGIARGEVTSEPADFGREAAPAPPPEPVFEECVRCDGKGYLVSQRAYTTRYAPRITYRNGLQITERTSITSSLPHYDGICDACKGNGGFLVW